MAEEEKKGKVIIEKEGESPKEIDSDELTPEDLEGVAGGSFSLSGFIKTGAPKLM